MTSFARLPGFNLDPTPTLHVISRIFLVRISRQALRQPVGARPLRLSRCPAALRHCGAAAHRHSAVASSLDGHFACEGPRDCACYERERPHDEVNSDVVSTDEEGEWSTEESSVRMRYEEEK